MTNFDPLHEIRERRRRLARRDAIGCGIAGAVLMIVALIAGAAEFCEEAALLGCVSYLATVLGVAFAIEA